MEIPEALLIPSALVYVTGLMVALKHRCEEGRPEAMERLLEFLEKDAVLRLFYLVASAADVVLWPLVWPCIGLRWSLSAPRLCGVPRGRVAAVARRLAAPLRSSWPRAGRRPRRRYARVAVLDPEDGRGPEAAGASEPAGDPGAASPLAIGDGGDRGERGSPPAPSAEGRGSLDVVGTAQPPPPYTPAAPTDVNSGQVMAGLDFTQGTC